MSRLLPPMSTWLFSCIARLAPAPLIALAAALYVPYCAALVTFTQEQVETAMEIVEQLEERHYAKLKYDDALSSLHLDSYIDRLDNRKMYFIEADLRDFESYRHQLDDQWRKGELGAGSEIFNRFDQRIKNRLQQLVDNLETMLQDFDYTRDEFVNLDDEELPWASTQEQLDERWRKQIKDQALRLKLAEKPEPEIAKTLIKRYRNQLKRITQYNSQDVFQLYANALTELYDPHTNYLSPRRSENFNINMSLSLEGIGAVLQLEDEYTKVARLIAKGPADKQGELQPADKIVGVGQGDAGEVEDVIGWRLDEVVNLIRGPKGTKVRLEVIPAKAPETHEVITIERNKVKLEEQSAQKEVLEIGEEDQVRRIGVIDIPAFYIDFAAMRRGEKDYKSTTRDVKKLLAELQQEGVDGVVIDLRNNGGGSLQEANELTGLFIEYGPTVQIRHSSRRVWRDGKRLRSDYYEGPMAVMINRLSASASEIFAGAIQDYQRGLVLGDQSFGKGTVQTLIPLTEGQLKLTESKFYRISGDSTQHRGVVPDIIFPSLYDHGEIGESSLEHAMAWDQINPVRHRRYHDLKVLLPKLTESFTHRADSNPDFTYLEDQIKLIQETRGITSLPLNESQRLALRNKREKQALAVENKRRTARGETLLSELDEEEASTDADHSLTSEDTEQEDDVLLTEAGRILLDALVIQGERYAVTEQQTLN